MTSTKILLRRRAAAVCLASFFSVVSPAASRGSSLSGPAEIAGVPNFQKVNDSVYRGAQPTDQGFKALAGVGIKTIIDLREIGEHSQADEEKAVKANGMRYVSVPMKGMSSPTAEQVSSVLALLNDDTAGPVFVHCRRGADRTGTVIACYRIAHDHWQNDKALSEARSYGMSWFERAMQHYVQAFSGAVLEAVTQKTAAITAVGAP